MSTPTMQPKYRYFITDLNDGDVKGTDDKERAMSAATSIDFFVVDVLIGQWFDEDGDPMDVKELK